MTEPDDPRSTSTETQVTWGTPSVAAGPLPHTAAPEARPRSRVDLGEVTAALSALGERLGALEGVVASREDLRADVDRLADGTSRALQQLADQISASLRELRPAVAAVAGDTAGMRLAMEALRSQQAEQHQRDQARADVMATKLAELGSAVEAIAQVRSSVEALAAMEGQLAALAEGAPALAAIPDLQAAVEPIGGLAEVLDGLAARVATAEQAAVDRIAAAEQATAERIAAVEQTAAERHEEHGNRLAEAVAAQRSAVEAARDELADQGGTIQAVAAVLDAVAVGIRDARLDANERAERIEEVVSSLVEQPNVVADVVRQLLERHSQRQAIELGTELEPIRAALAALPGDREALVEALGARLDEHALALGDQQGRVVGDLRTLVSGQHVDLVAAVRTALTEAAETADVTADQRTNQLQGALLDQQALLVEVVRTTLGEAADRAAQAARDERRVLGHAMGERHDELVGQVRAELAQAASSATEAQHHLREGVRSALREVQTGLGEVLRTSLIDQADRLAEATAATAATARADAEALRTSLFEQQADLAEAVLRSLSEAAGEADADRRREAEARAAELTELRAALLGQYAASGTVLRELLDEQSGVDRAQRAEELRDLRAEVLDNQAALAAAVRELLADAGATEAQRREAALDRMLEALGARQATELDRLTRELQGSVADAGRAEAEARRADAAALRDELAQLLAALQAGVIDRLERALRTDAKTLRSTLATGFDQVSTTFGESMVASVETILQRDAESRRGELAELQADVGRSLASLASTVTRGTEAGVVQGDRLRAELERSVTEVRDGVERILASQVGSQSERVDHLRTEVRGGLADLEEAVTSALEAGLGAFEQRAIGLRSEVSSAMYEVQQLILEASRADAEVVDGAIASAQRRIDEVAAATRAVALEQAELRDLLEQALRLGRG